MAVQINLGTALVRVLQCSDIRSNELNLQGGQCLHSSIHDSHFTISHIHTLTHTHSLLELAWLVAAATRRSCQLSVCRYRRLSAASNIRRDALNLEKKPGKWQMDNAAVKRQKNICEVN